MRFYVLEYQYDTDTQARHGLLRRKRPCLAV